MNTIGEKVESLTFTSRAAVTPRHWVRNSALAFAVFLGSVVLVTMPKALDHPLTLWINRAVARSDSLDTLMIALNEDFSYSGVALIALLWFCWFDTTNVIARARIIIGTLLCFPIGMLSRLTQHLLPTHPRPYYDHAIVSSGHLISANS